MLCQAVFLLLFIGINGNDNTTRAMFDGFVSKKPNKSHLKLKQSDFIKLVCFLVFAVFAIPLKHHWKYFVKQQVKLHPKSDLEAIEQLVQESTELENGLRNLDLNLTEVCFSRAMKRLNIDNSTDPAFSNSLHC